MSDRQARGIIELAAQTRIDEIAARRSGMNIWALGDYHRFAKETIWELGPVLVHACGIRAGQRVLDAAAGSGNVALRAAQAGADVVAADVTRESLEAGRREARALGVDLEWVEADVQDLPFEPESFDIVTSSFGAMFAPDHQATASELLRVCRPGGTIGLLSFTPEGLGGRFFGVFGPYLPPPPPGALPPILWGDESHVRELFGERVASLELSRGTYAERSESPESYVRLFKDTFGPVVALYDGLVGDPERLEALDRDFHDYAAREARPSGDGVEYEYEYLLVLARKR
jgi:ubiquinone/menaquinone biosynthesis C-methylase UbiE